MKNLILLILLLVISSCKSDYPTANSIHHSNISINAIPIDDLESGFYLNQFQGGFYPDGTNTAPFRYDSIGIESTKKIKLLNTSGTPMSGGKIVFLSVGFSNAAMEWCTKTTTTSFPACNSWSFIEKAKADTSVRKESLRIFNGAMGGQTNDAWDNTTDPDYNIVLSRLSAVNLSNKQVQIVWLKIANAQPNTPLPAANADAYKLLASTGNIIRTLKTKYPNLQQIFITSRIYAGNATTTLNPEPYAYEAGFTIKWIINAYINQLETGTIDPVVGKFPNVFVAWGPYMWANGATSSLSGRAWYPSDFQIDGTHPNTQGQTKAANMLLSFFKTSNYTKCWFVKNQSC